MTEPSFSYTVCGVDTSQKERHKNPMLTSSRLAPCCRVRHWCRPARPQCESGWGRASSPPPSWTPPAPARRLLANLHTAIVIISVIAIVVIIIYSFSRHHHFREPDFVQYCTVPYLKRSHSHQQCCRSLLALGSGISWVKIKIWIPDPGSWYGMNIPDHISESLETIFWLKILTIPRCGCGSGIF